MKSPTTGKEMKLIKQKREFEFRKEKFTIIYHSYRCDESGEQFTDTALDELNMNQVYNQYRDMYNIPFPEEIMSTREKYGVSAAKMSEILGFGVNGYRNYEAGEMPSVSNGKLIQMADNPVNFKEMILLSEAVDEKLEVKLLKKVEELIEDSQRNIFDLNIRDYLLGVHSADIYSGYRKPNLEKFTEMVVFFAQQMRPYKTKMNKLLFYSDFLMYKLTGFSISGVRYKAIGMGPVPANFNSVFEYIDNMKDIEIHYQPFQNGLGEQFRARKERPFNQELFTEKEQEVLSQVAKRFKKESTAGIIELSHQEEAWKKNQKAKSELSYNDAFELKAI